MSTAKNPPGDPAHSPADDPLPRLMALAGPRWDAPPEVEAAIKGSLHLAWQAKVAARAAARQRQRGYLALAATVLLGLGLTFWLGGNGEGKTSRSRGQGSAAEGSEVARIEQWFAASKELREGRLGEGEAVLVGSELATTAGDRVALRLAGGQFMRLDTGSRVRFGPAGEIRLLAGALYIDTGATAVPVEIETAYGLVRDIGTQFQVRLGEKGLSVRVRQGEIRLEMAAASHAAVAGEVLTTTGSGVLSRASSSSRDAAWDWLLLATPDFEMEGRSVHAVLTWVARQRGQTLRYADQQSRSLALRVTASGSSAGLTPDELLQLILPSSGLIHQAGGEDGTELLIRRPDAGGRYED